MCNRLLKAESVLEYFYQHDFTFHNENVQGLWASISQTDKKLFHFDISELNWHQYYCRYQRGIKQFIFKEGVKDNDLEKAHKNMRRLLWVHRATQLVAMYATWRLLSSNRSFSCLSSIYSRALKLLPRSYARNMKTLTRNQSTLINICQFLLLLLFVQLKI